MRTLVKCALLFASVAMAIPAVGQSVISVRSGVIYYFDGSVYLAGQPLENHLGKFASVPEGAEFRTAQGHAEVLLTPGVFLRMGENSSIRMVENDLANTRVQLESGSIIVDSGEPAPGTAVTVVFGDRRVQSSAAGTYRIDSNPPRLWVIKGEAEVVTGNQGQRLTVSDGKDLSLGESLAPEAGSTAPVDGLTNWANGRSDSIVADDSITQQIDADPASQSANLDGLIDFPLLGLPVTGLSFNPFNGYNTTLSGQPGFYSMYLPGYTYAPLLVMMLGRSRGVLPGIPLRLVISPGLGRMYPTAPMTGAAPIRPMVPRPVPELAHPVAHPMTRPAVHR